MKTLIELARKQSLKSSFRQRVGACLVKDGKVISVGYNIINNDLPFSTEHWVSSTHAEMMCLMRLIKKGRVKQIAGSTMYVVRTMKSGQLGLAMPCQPCYRVMSALKVRSVIFSNDDQGFSTIIL